MPCRRAEHPQWKSTRTRSPTTTTTLYWNELSRFPSASSYFASIFVLSVLWNSSHICHFFFEALGMTCRLKKLFTAPPRSFASPSAMEWGTHFSAPPLPRVPPSFHRTPIAITELTSCGQVFTKFLLPARNLMPGIPEPIGAGVPHVWRDFLGRWREVGNKNRSRGQST